MERPGKHVLDLSAAKLKELQEQDKTLQSVRENADRSPTTSKFYYRDGLLYRRWTPPGRDDGELDVEQLVLPKSCRRKKVLEIAHEILLLVIWVKRKQDEESYKDSIGLLSTRM